VNGSNFSYLLPIANLGNPGDFKPPSRGFKASKLDILPAIQWSVKYAGSVGTWLVGAYLTPLSPLQPEALVENHRY
jgi:hypothetical protein